MAVSTVSTNYASTSTSSTTSTDSTSLGKEDFLELLVEQLKNQDPLNPMDNTEYIAQLTQFSSVEQLMNISEKLDTLSMNLGSASTLIGKTIEWAELDDSGSVVSKSGIVDSIYMGEDGLYAQVGDTQILLDVIQSVHDSAADEESADSGEAEETEEAAGSEETAETDSSGTEGTEEA